MGVGVVWVHQSHLFGAEWGAVVDVAADFGA